MKHRASRVLAVFVGAALLFFGTYHLRRKARVSATRTSSPHRGLQTLFAHDTDRSIQSTGVDGRVLAESGAPIAGARVCAACANCSERTVDSVRCTVSDGAGRFALQLAASSPYVLSAQARGFVTAYARDGKPFFVAPEASDHFELHLVQGRENLSGMVVDALGGPIAEARVKAIRTVDALTPTVEVVSNQDGKFELTVPEGHISLRAEAEGYAPTTALHSAPGQDLLIALIPESRVRGVVVEAGTGRLVEGVSILAYPERAVPRHPETVSDDAGEFEIKGLEPGRYTFAAEGEHHRGVAERSLEVGLAERIDNLRIEVTPAALVLGKVEIAETGEPCAQGRVGLGPRSPVTIPVADEPAQTAGDDLASVVAPIEHDGTVRLKGVPAGRYHVTLHCFDHLYASGPAIVDVRSDTAPLLWKVTAGAGLVVHVLDANRRPVPGALLSLEFPEQDGRRAMMGLPCDQQGKAVMSRSLRPGSYRVHPDRKYQSSPLTVEIPRLGGVTEVTLQLAGSAEVVVAVTTRNGEPVDDVRVIATRADERGSASAPPPGTATGPTWSDAAEIRATALGSGRYRLSPLVPASYRVEVRDGDNPPLTVASSLSVAAGAHAALTTIVDRGGWIRGRVVDEQGTPVENAWVRAEAQHGERDLYDDLLNPGRGVGISRVLSDAQGNFRLERLATSALYKLRAEQHHGAVAELKDVREGSSITLRLPSPGTLEGVVLSENGEPARSFQISASLPEVPEAVRMLRVHSTQGKFHLEGVPVGRLQLQVVGAGGQFAEAWVDLAPNQVLDGLRLSLRRAAEPARSPVEPGSTPDSEGSAGGA